MSSTKSEENGGSERVENGEVKKNGEESTEISSSDNKVKPVKGNYEHLYLPSLNLTLILLSI